MVASFYIQTMFLECIGIVKQIKTIPSYKHHRACDSLAEMNGLETSIRR